MNHTTLRPGLARRLPVAAALGALAVGLALVPAGAASAVPVQTMHGQIVTPTQPFDTSTDTFASQPEWLGAYEVNGVRSWATSFALGAPDSAALTSLVTIATKWQGHLTAAQQAQLSTLLVMHGNAMNDDEAAAVSLLILDDMSSPTAAGHAAGDDTDPSRKVDSIAFDKAYALSKVDATVQTDAAALDTESQLFSGQWTLDIEAPATAKVGSASNWTVRVVGPDGTTGVPNRPITLTAAHGVFANGTKTITATTPGDGTAAMIALTPTGMAPSISAASEAPAAAPTFLQPFNGDTPDTTRSPYFQENDVDLSASLGTTAVGSPASGTPVLALTGATVPVGVPIAGGALVLAGLALLLITSRRRSRIGRR
jgi:hypothetical protein